MNEYIPEIIIGVVTFLGGFFANFFGLLGKFGDKKIKYEEILMTKNENLLNRLERELEEAHAHIDRLESIFSEYRTKNDERIKKLETENLNLRAELAKYR